MASCNHCKYFPGCFIGAKCILFPVLAAFLIACRDNPGQSGQVVFFDSPASPQEFFPRAEPETVGIDHAALAALVAEAQNTHFFSDKAGIAQFETGQFKTAKHSPFLLGSTHYIFLMGIRNTAERSFDDIQKRSCRRTT